MIDSNLAKEVDKKIQLLIRIHLMANFRSDGIFQIFKTKKYIYKSFVKKYS